jgi:hypothetical protein
MQQTNYAFNTKIGDSDTSQTLSQEHGSLELDWCICCGLVKSEYGSIYCSTLCFRQILQSQDHYFSVDLSPSQQCNELLDSCSDDSISSSVSNSRSQSNLSVYGSLKMSRRKRRIKPSFTGARIQ